MASSNRPLIEHSDEELIARLGAETSQVAYSANDYLAELERRSRHRHAAWMARLTVVVAIATLVNALVGILNVVGPRLPADSTSRSVSSPAGSPSASAVAGVTTPSSGIGSSPSSAGPTGEPTAMASPGRLRLHKFNVECPLALPDEAEVREQVVESVLDEASTLLSGGTIEISGTTWVCTPLLIRGSVLAEAEPGSTPPPAIEEHLLVTIVAEPRLPEPPSLGLVLEAEFVTSLPYWVPLPDLQPDRVRCQDVAQSPLPGLPSPASVGTAIETCADHLLRLYGP